MAQTEDERMRLRALARWETEGGGLGRSGPPTDALEDSELRILARIGHAALGRWDLLPAQAKDAIVAHVWRPLAPGDRALARSRIAAFLRDYSDR